MSSETDCDPSNITTTTTEQESEEQFIYPSPCYQQFLDVMKCNHHVSSVMQIAEKSNLLQLNEPDLEIGSVCNKALKEYMQCVPVPRYNSWTSQVKEEGEEEQQVEDKVVEENGDQIEEKEPTVEELHDAAVDLFLQNDLIYFDTVVRLRQEELQQKAAAPTKM